MGIFSAKIKGFSDRAMRNADLVFRASVQDLGEQMTRRVDGVTRGAPFREGYVPVDTGELINSHEVAVNGGVIAKGSNGQPPDYVAAIAGLTFGDTVTGVFTAPYARVVEYKHGRFFVRNAARNWQAIVGANARLFE